MSAIDTLHTIWMRFPEQHCPNKWSESPHENLASPARSGWNGKCLVFVPDILFCTPLRLHSVWHGLNFDYLLGQCLGFVKYPTIFGCVMHAIAMHSGRNVQQGIEFANKSALNLISWHTVLYYLVIHCKETNPRVHARRFKRMHVSKIVASFPVHE